MHSTNHQLEHFFVAGISYRKSDTDVRGRYAINNDQYISLLKMAGEIGIKELFVVSTCNRTEIYGVADSVQQLVWLVCSVTRGFVSDFMECSYVHKGTDAITHLFKVAAGLDSQILGDMEILGQIKTAAKLSKSHNCIGAFTERLLNNVMQSSKAVKTNTQLSGGTVSVSFAAIQCIREHFTTTTDKKVLVVGTGKIGRSTCRNIVDYLGTGDITLLNRTEETAVTLATELGLRAANFESLEQEISGADIVVVSTSASEPVLLPSHIHNNRPRLILDLSVPCNVAPEIAQLKGVTLVNVDALSRINDETIENRRAEAPAALAIINEHIAEFRDWCAMRRYAPLLKAMKHTLADMPLETVSQGKTNGNKKADTIQSVINVMATKMRKSNTAGCHCIEAINDFIAIHV